jgi:hypothetical protein
MNDQNMESHRQKSARGISTIWIVLIAIIVTAALSYWVITTYIYPQDFTPVVLKPDEQQRLDRKLRLVGYQPDTSYSAQSVPQKHQDFDRDGRLIAQKYSEENGERDVEFSEKELNALLASNPDMARKLAIDLSDDLISARLLIPLDKDFPVMGGRTLRVSAGVEMAFSNGRPRVILKGVTVMGVPIPNAWLGNLKNIDLINEFGDRQGFWKSFADGVEDIHVEEGRLKVKLKP